MEQNKAALIILTVSCIFLFGNIAISDKLPVDKNGKVIDASLKKKHKQGPIILPAQEGSVSGFNQSVYKKQMKIFKDSIFSTDAFKSYAADPEDNYKRIKIVVSDGWYECAAYMKERTIKQIGQAYAQIRIRSGVPNSIENFPEVIFQDAYGEKVAKSDTWGVKVYK
jgi:hypothetical protein